MDQPEHFVKARHNVFLGIGWHMIGQIAETNTYIHAGRTKCIHGFTGFRKREGRSPRVAQNLSMTVVCVRKNSDFHISYAVLSIYDLKLLSNAHPSLAQNSRASQRKIGAFFDSDYRIWVGDGAFDVP